MEQPFSIQTLDDNHQVLTGEIDAYRLEIYLSSRAIKQIRLIYYGWSTSDVMIENGFVVNATMSNITCGQTDPDPKIMMPNNHTAVEATVKWLYKNLGFCSPHEDVRVIMDEVVSILARRWHVRCAGLHTSFIPENSPLGQIIATHYGNGQTDMPCISMELCPQCNRISY